MGRILRLWQVWLKVKYYISNYRPVPIEEHLVYENAVYAVCTSRQFFKTAPSLNLQTSLQELEDLLPSRKIETSQHQELINPVLNSVAVELDVN